MKFVSPKSLMLVFVVFGRHAYSYSLSLDAAVNVEGKSETLSSSLAMVPFFIEWMTVVGKVYDSQNEQMSRFEVWMENDGEFYS